MPHSSLLHSLQLRQELRLSPGKAETINRLQRHLRRLQPHQNTVCTSLLNKFTQIIKTYIVLKLRKKMLWPKRMTLSVPLAFKSTLELAILQRNKF